MRILAFLTDARPTDDFDQTPDFDPADAVHHSGRYPSRVELSVGPGGP